MKNLIILILFIPLFAWADTPPPNTVKAKVFDGSGTQSIGYTGTSLNTFFTNSSLAVTGTFWQSVQPVSQSGNWSLRLQDGSGNLINSTSNSLNVDVTNTVPISGTVTATNSANGATGSAVPSQATQVGGVNGGNLTAMKVESDGTVVVDASAHTVPVSGTFWQSTQPVSQSGSWTVIANAGTNLNTSLLALDTSVNGILLSQGSSTSGQKGPLLQGAVLSSAPTYTTAETSPLTLTTAGALRVDGSAVTQPISATSLPLPTGAATAAGLSTINTTLGSPFQAGGSIGNTSFAATQATASNLNATVVGTGGAALATSAGLTTINTTLGSPMQNSGGSVTANAGTGTFNVAGSVTVTPATPSALTVYAAAITVGTSAVRLTHNGSAPASTRVLLVAQLAAASSASCYFGPSTVTTSGSTQGVQMFAGQSFTWNHDAGDYYAICGTASQTFNVVEQE